jgi:hypothetical protein
MISHYGELSHLPSGHSVLVLPVNFTVTALIFALFVTFNCNFPRSRADFEEVFWVVPSWSRPVRNMTGSARIMEHDTPFPEQTGFSASCVSFEETEIELITELALRLCLGTAPGGLPPRDGLDIAIGESSTTVPAVALLANIVVGSADADENDAPIVCGLADLEEVAAEDGAAELDEEKGVKTEPSTRFAFSREASLLSFT